ncbi:ImmA/IrrE family metallo-endopeptidase [Paenibacillus sp. F411]|uniref:ImmA/IrrE family metallo-endopeptidase n=1 Tax=Paenibacillus sp. F411 TaxID=2820239 RepID=UPI001AAF2081|nr:ImmA/IrrE family metallo-endopeptidase [Paenibacillus sp. F411]MBO2946123.1 ImmA/IrrE family metallo-endopeptidase [Paenibacillus sp. F411]
MNHREKAEKVAEVYAVSFLKDAIGHDIFIGSHIERLLADKVNLIYQYVEDGNYYGAAIQHQNGEQFVVLNTFHSLRTRYFTAAHELWHLSEASLMQDGNFDHERAADRFAAAIMLPKELTKQLWNKFKKQDDEVAILKIADLADVPYVAVVRRLSELGENVPSKKITEMEWLEKRSELGFPISVSDYSSKDTRFVAYEHAVKENVEKKGLDILIAANKLSKFAPKLAEQYQSAALSRGHEVDA